MRFILASSSPRRREIISRIVDDFEIIKPHIDEIRRPDESPIEYGQRLSIEKAQAVAEQVQQETDIAILAADTVVILAADTIGIGKNDEIFEKPDNAEVATDMLKRLRNRAHNVCTSFTLLYGEQRHTETVCTTVHMRDYSDEEIAAYIATGDPFDKAGSYAIQHQGFRPVAKIEGSRTNVIGLPEDEVRTALQQLGVLS